jgi:hypothetical protein
MKLFQYNIDPEQIDVNPDLLAKLMGFDPKEIPEPYLGLINQEMDQIAGYHNIKGGYRIFENFKLNLLNYTIIIDNVSFHAGKQVVHYLRNSEMLAFFACTAGGEITDRSKQFMEAGNFLEGYVTDLTGSVIAEAAMDWMQNKLKEQMGQMGLKITNRYSPGYCNWNVSEQHRLFSLFPENFCGISLTESALMKPVKSVSGIIGIGTKVRYDKYVCNACSSKDCIYRRVKQSVDD